MMTPRLIPIILWQANSVPLSVVIDLTCSLNGDGKCITVRANSLVFFPFDILLCHATCRLSSIYDLYLNK